MFPVGWDKTYCFRYLKDFDKVIFFGDKCYPGGNDYEIYMHERTEGHKVKNPEETKKLLKEMFNL